ncbi:MAG TPA: helix-hairpin-helix domain-containing protein, partial [Terriglobales bacterium]|nr:helix-hairpin-helix domain-containing protein [Terriglobales bacterium]
MTITNREIADTFETVADMLQIKGENIHRVLAYRNAALSIRELGRDIHVIATEGGLEDIPFIGETLAS